jgi:hypothetical protein
MTLTGKLLAALALTLVATAVVPGCKRVIVYVDPDGGVVDPNADGGGLPGQDGFEGCASATAKAELAPLDLFIALDTSFSMDFDGKWYAVSSALDSFVTNNASVKGLGLGLQYFPLRQQCNVDLYASPAVPFEELPAVAPKISTSLAAQRMAGGTPIVQILEGAIAYTQAWYAAHPDRKVAILVATDGVPDETCPVAMAPRLPNNLANAVALATQSKDAAVPVFVIGVGADLDALNQIAAAGGSTQAIFVETNGSAEQAFLEALNKIRGNAVSCDFTVPTAPGQTIDYSRVNVVFSASPTAPSDTFVQVASAAECALAGARGWYYDDPLAPTKVLLCPQACEAVAKAGEAKIDVVFGCSTIVL